MAMEMGGGKGEVVQLEDERARISMRLRMLVLSVAQEARRSKARHCEVASGMRRGQAQAKEKGKERKARQAGQAIVIVVVLEVGDPKTVPHSSAGQSKLW